MNTEITLPAKGLYIPKSRTQVLLILPLSYLLLRPSVIKSLGPPFRSALTGETEGLPWMWQAEREYWSPDNPCPQLRR